MKFSVAVKKYFPFFFAGALLSLAFAPISLVGLGLISLAWLFYQLVRDKKSPLHLPIKSHSCINILAKIFPRRTSLRGAVLRSVSGVIQRRGNPDIEIKCFSGLPRRVLHCGASLAYKTLLAMTFSVGSYTEHELFKQQCPLKKRGGDSFKAGWAYGTGLFTAGTSWIYISIHTYGRADVFSSILVTILFCLFMGFYYGLFALSFSLLSRFIKCENLWFKAFNFSVIWVAFEYLRATLFTGFPWLLLGFSQTQTPMKYLAPIMGVYGLSFLVGFSGGLLAIAWIGLTLKNERSGKKYQTRRWMPAILCLLSLYCLPQLLSFFHWTTPVSSAIPVSIIQGNIGEDEKWLPHAYEKTITHYVNLTRRVLEKKIPPAPPFVKGGIHHKDLSNGEIHPENLSEKATSKVTSKTPIEALADQHNQHRRNLKQPYEATTPTRIIVWPEGAIPVPYPYSAAFLTRLSSFLAEKNATLVTGIPYQNAKNNEQYFNAMLLLGKSEGRYFKHHIVPFGEYVPAAVFHDIMNWLGISLYETGRGAFTQPLLNIEGIAALPFICYEIAYADILFQSLPEAQLFITISDDAWFGRSLARAQHLQIAQMRSLQAGRYQIVATNNGISAIIDAEGNVIKTIPSFETRILNSSIKAMSGSTPWGKVGDNTILIILFSGWLLIQLFCFFYSSRLKFRSSVSQHSG